MTQQQFDSQMSIARARDDARAPLTKLADAWTGLAYKAAIFFGQGQRIAGITKMIQLMIVPLK